MQHVRAAGQIERVTGRTAAQHVLGETSNLSRRKALQPLERYVHAFGVNDLEIVRAEIVCQRAIVALRAGDAIVIRRTPRWRSDCMAARRPVVARTRDA
jgi:hypothetical protein